MWFYIEEKKLLKQAEKVRYITIWIHSIKSGLFVHMY